MDFPPTDVARDVSHAIAKAIPPVTIWALTLNEWLAIASIAYLVLQAVYLVWKWRGEAIHHARAAAREEVERLLALRNGEAAP